MAGAMSHAAASVGLRNSVWGAGSGVLVPNEVGAGLEAPVCAAAKVMKTASGRSADCLFIGTYKLPEREFRR